MKNNRHSTGHTVADHSEEVGRILSGVPRGVIWWAAGIFLFVAAAVAALLWLTGLPLDIPGIKVIMQGR